MQGHLKPSSRVCRYTTLFKGQFHPVRDFRGQESELSLTYRLPFIPFSLSAFLLFVFSPFIKSHVSNYSGGTWPTAWTLLDNDTKKQVEGRGGRGAGHCVGSG